MQGRVDPAFLPDLPLHPPPFSPVMLGEGRSYLVRLGLATTFPILILLALHQSKDAIKADFHEELRITRALRCSLPAGGSIPQ